jgi:hypothetical protein
VVSLFSDRGTVSPRNALEHGNQKQRRKVYHTHMSFIELLHEVNRKSWTQMPGKR